MEPGFASGARECVAQLDCGRRLTYESRSLAPGAGEVVPCLWHGYCRVARVGFERHVPAAVPSRAQPRTQRELVEYVGGGPGRTLSSLRRHRFTLRMVQAAAHAGEVVIRDAGGDVMVYVAS
jgi:hypothetical protein